MLLHGVFTQHDPGLPAQELNAALLLLPNCFIVPDGYEEQRPGRSSPNDAGKPAYLAEIAREQWAQT